MALEEIEKKGGPYTKQEKEDRQNEVHKLHFEYGYSAVKIAETHDVNRNTINEDIKYLYSKLSSEWEGFDIESWILKQIDRLESQRSRFREELDNQKGIEDKMRIEKQISEIENKITQIVLKLNANKKEKPQQIQEISDEVVEDVIRYLKKLKGKDPIRYKYDDMMFEIIKHLKCDVSKALAIIERMKQTGLGFCQDDGIFDMNPSSYDLERFSEMRDIK